MAASRRSLSQRLVLALVGLSVGSVLLAGLITVVAARPATKSTAISELKRGLTILYEDDRDGVRPRLTVARLKNQLLANQVGVTAVLANGTLAAPGQTFTAPGVAGRLLDRFRNRVGNATPLVATLPNGVTRNALDPVKLVAGKVLSGSNGQIVWVAQPLTAQAEGTLVLIATRRIGFFALGRLGGRRCRSGWCGGSPVPCRPWSAPPGPSPGATSGPGSASRPGPPTTSWPRWPAPSTPWPPSWAGTGAWSGPSS